MACRVLVVDDNAVFARTLSRALEQRGFQVTWLTNGARVPAELGREEFGVAVLEAVLPGISGIRLLRQVRTISPRTRVIVVAASANLEVAVEAMKHGAVDYLAKPVSPEAVADQITRLVPSALELAAETADKAIIGDCPPMREVLALVERVADTDAPVLICGESGTGKELVARAIHRRSRRRSKLFLAVNCGALAEGVLDSELFGHVQGAFTDAFSARRGLFEEADQGTIFLDEIASTPLAFQVKLLRVLEDGQVRPVGSSTIMRTDARVIAAANVDLRDAVRAGRFRADLYYRLNVVSVILPPLRERGQDLELLVDHFVAKAARELGKAPPNVTGEFRSALRGYRWPGNVRELRNTIDRAILLSDGSLSADVVPSDPRIAEEPDDRLRPYAEAKREAMDRFTRDYLNRLLPQHGGNVTRAAQAACIPRQTLHRLLRSVRKELGRV